MQESIDRSGIDGEKLFAYLCAEIQMPVALDHLDQCRQKWHQPFRINSVSHLPQLNGRRLNRLVVLPRSVVPHRDASQRGELIQQRYGLFSMVAGGGHELRQDLVLLIATRLPIPPCYVRYQFSS